MDKTLYSYPVDTFHKNDNDFDDANWISIQEIVNKQNVFSNNNDNNRRSMSYPINNQFFPTETLLNKDTEDISTSSNIIKRRSTNVNNIENLNIDTCAVFDINNKNKIELKTFRITETEDVVENYTKF